MDRIGVHKQKVFFFARFFLCLFFRFCFVIPYVGFSSEAPLNNLFFPQELLWNSAEAEFPNMYTAIKILQLSEI